MSWLLFLEEPGAHQSALPYGVLAGLAVEDTQVWPLARKILSAQEQYLGGQLLSPDGGFTDANALLSKEIFESAASATKIDSQRSLRVDDSASGREGVKDVGPDVALSQAKIAYCEFALSLAKDYGGVAFAIPIEIDQITLKFEGQLRKDYAFLFERFFYFLKSNASSGMGVVAIAEKKGGNLFASSAEISEYFLKTKNGRARASRVIPTPFYTTGFMNALPHLTEMISYAVSWSIRLQGMTKPGRPELSRIGALCSAMRFSYISGNGRRDWSFKYLPDLRPSTSPSMKTVKSVGKD